MEAAAPVARQRLAESVQCSPASCAASPWPTHTACSAIDASTWPSPSRLLAMSAVVGIIAGTTCSFTVGRIIRDSWQLMTCRWTLLRSRHLRTFGWLLKRVGTACVEFFLSFSLECLLFAQGKALLRLCCWGWHARLVLQKEMSLAWGASIVPLSHDEVKCCVGKIKQWTVKHGLPCGYWMRLKNFLKISLLSCICFSNLQSRDALFS